MNANFNTPKSERLHIGFFGRCNSGKSALINTLTGQKVAIVSDIAGTTTDPVVKSMEFPGVGAAVLIDTAGFDDSTDLGKKRTEQTLKILDKTDIAILLFCGEDISKEVEWYAEMHKRDIPVVGVLSKCDIVDNVAVIENQIYSATGMKPILLSSKTKEGIDLLRKAIANSYEDEHILLTEGICESGDTVVLVMPQDSQAPKGRLIKPQVEVLRELLDKGCNALCCTDVGLAAALASLASPPKLIITDSQVFSVVYPIKPKESLLTSFSILFAKYKGDINLFVEGAKLITSLGPTARILIAESCTHTPQHEDIGRVKLPKMLRRHLGDKIEIDIVAGNDFPKDLSTYDLIIHCGACMFNRQHVMSRIAMAKSQNVPITNYGVAMALLTGILSKVSY